MPRSLRRGCGAAAALFGVWLGFVLVVPVVTVDRPFSTVLVDRNGELLSAALAVDEQWRFPLRGEVPEKFERAIVRFEDRRFGYHPGVDLLAVARAAVHNLRAGEVVSGASTLSMQVVRLSRPGEARTVGEKLIEMVLAVRLELSASKQEILALYAAHAPFGGNVVGLEAAAWRYFGRPASELSWGEAATLAVLPNNPGLVHLGRNRERLRSRRDALLNRLAAAGDIDAETLVLARAEPLPRAPSPIPRTAPHLLVRLTDRSRPFVRTTIDRELQTRASAQLRRHHELWRGNGVHNAAAIIVHVPTSEVLAYVGNIVDFDDPQHHNHVDIITAPRSSGSLLKPFLYSAALDAGELLPHQLVADVPTSLGGFSPENYDRKYSGAVPAAQALARSLNVPAVRMLQSYGVDRFYSVLAQWGMSTLHRRAGDYGLALILGGAEGTLWDMTGMYTNMARAAQRFSDRVEPLRMTAGARSSEDEAASPVAAASAYLTMEALLEVQRPGVDQLWRRFAGSRPVAWKTGTSFGFRDGWAIGVTPEYAVGVWVGNADGEGRPLLTGYRAAAPAMFDLFELLPETTWFKMPGGLVEVEVCAHSGMRAGPGCGAKRREWVPKASLRARGCSYCRQVHCDHGCRHQVHARCAGVGDMETRPWFVLPAGMEYFYRERHADYRPLPPLRRDCMATREERAVSCVYPQEGARLYVPVELDGEGGRVVFQAAHRRPATRVFWHLDDDYVGVTEHLHQLALAPTPGEHVLTLMDAHGELFRRRFEVLDED